MGTLLQFFSDSPLLQRIRISISTETVQDISPDRVISLNSLVEMDYYSYYQAGSILPFLRLPRLKMLCATSSAGPGQVQRLADILPHDGHALLAQMVRVLYRYNPDLEIVSVDLSGNEVEASFHAIYTDGIVDWFSDQTAIPFGRIEELVIEGSSSAAGFPIDVFALKNLKILQVAPWDGQFAEEVLRPFHPVPEMEVPCQSLREIEYSYRGDDGPLPTSLISLVKKRKQAGYQLDLVCLAVVRESDLDLVEELREDVLEVQARLWDGKE